MDIHEKVDRIAWEKDKLKNEQELLDEANKDIGSFTKSSIEYGIRRGGITGMKLGFALGVLLSLFVYFIFN